MQLSQSALLIRLSKYTLGLISSSSLASEVSEISTRTGKAPFGVGANN